LMGPHCRICESVLSESGGNPPERRKARAAGRSSGSTRESGSSGEGCAAARTDLCFMTPTVRAIPILAKFRLLTDLISWFSVVIQVVLLDEVVLDARAGGGPEDGGEVGDAVANFLELGFPR